MPSSVVITCSFRWIHCIEVAWGVNLVGGGESELELSQEGTTFIRMKRRWALVMYVCTKTIIRAAINFRFKHLQSLSLFTFFSFGFLLTNFKNISRGGGGMTSRKGNRFPAPPPLHVALVRWACLSLFAYSRTIAVVLIPRTICLTPLARMLSCQTGLAGLSRTRWTSTPPSSMVALHWLAASRNRSPCLLSPAPPN